MDIQIYPRYILYGVRRTMRFTLISALFIITLLGCESKGNTPTVPTYHQIQERMEDFRELPEIDSLHLKHNKKYRATISDLEESPSSVGSITVDVNGKDLHLILSNFVKSDTISINDEIVIEIKEKSDEWDNTWIVRFIDKIEVSE